MKLSSDDKLFAEYISLGRSNQFNELKRQVKKKIEQLKLDASEFEMKFEDPGHELFSISLRTLYFEHILKLFNTFDFRELIKIFRMKT